ncbi:MAG: adenosylmethionine--8-amino-7-oxononanoate transaminase [Candidatus Gastranaerophilales bacterium]|nr:adenosylmethionine--8-amino-7-oxononanoate transaminase [Candidatus Gastranaerophilales bacterium]
MEYNDLNSKIWHPFTQHGLGEPIIKIERAKDEFLYTSDGKVIIDGISSWWVNTHGHSNPQIIEAVSKQVQELQQVIFAGFTHNPAEEVAAKIRGFLPPKLEYIFFSDSGSTSVEVALKMAVGYWYNKGFENKTKIVAFKKSYHGDTFGGMSSGDCSVFSKPYAKMFFDVVHLPYPEKGREDFTIAYYENLLKKEASNIAAIILEPLILGSGGMLIYESFVLDELYRLSKEYDVIFILDEVMTGWGRTGTMFAFEQTNIVPDILCLSKGLTGGHLPLAVTVSSREIYDAFYSKDKAKMFFHSSSYTANPVACAAASANLDICMENSGKNVLDKVKFINNYHTGKKEKFEQNDLVKNPRILGSIFAFDIKTDKEGYLADLAVDLSKYYIENGVLLRPLGNTVYIMPSYCILQSSLDKIYDTIEKSLEDVRLNRNEFKVVN